MRSKGTSITLFHSYPVLLCIIQRGTQILPKRIDVNLFQIPKNNTGISGTCRVGIKKDVRVLIAVFHSPTEIVFLDTSGEAARCVNTRQ
jgi:hypothetical protein